jgi:broad-specificity NMP kinase
MGSRQKVTRFLEASEAHQHYESIVEMALSYLVAKAEKEGRDQFAAELRTEREGYREEFAKALAVTEEVYCEVFTDEELDDLIVLHSNPAIKKSRLLTSEIMNKILEKWSQLSGLNFPAVS